MPPDLPRLLKSCRDIMRKDRGLSGDLDRLQQLSWMLLLKLLDEADSDLIPPPCRWRDWAAGSDAFTAKRLVAFVEDPTDGLLARLGALGGDRRREVIAAVFRGARNHMRSGQLMRDVMRRLDEVVPEPGQHQELSRLYEAMLAAVGAAGDSGEFYTPRPVVRLMVAVTDPRPGETVLDPACGTGGFLAEAHRHMARQGSGGLVRGVEAKPLPHLLAQVNLLLHGVEDPRVGHGNGLTTPQRPADVILTNPPFGGEEEQAVQAGFPRDLRTLDTTLLFLQVIINGLRSPGGRAAVVVPESVMGDGGVARRVRELLLRQLNLHTVVRLPRGVFEPYTDIQTNLLFFDSRASTDQVWFYQHEVPPRRRRQQDPCYTRTRPLRFEELEPIIRWWSRREEQRNAWRVSVDQLRLRGWSLDSRPPGRGASRPVDHALAPAELVEQDLARCQDLAAAIPRILGPDGAPDRWPPVPLSAFLKRARQRVRIQPDLDYQQITVRLHGRGVVPRGAVKGTSLTASRRFLAREGQLIMSRIDARNGAFGIVPAGLDGAVVTGDFPLYDLDPHLVDAAYLALVLGSPSFEDLCARCSRGTTNRKRIQEDLLLQQRLRLPPLDVQRKAVEAAQTLSALRDEAAGLERHAADLLARLADAHTFLVGDE